MSYQLIKTVTSESWIKLSGKLSLHDFQELQALAKSSLERFGQVKMLVELEGFDGWTREVGWEDSFFLAEDGNSHSRLAFVGDESWKDDVYMFTGKPMRKTAIEFFPQDKLAEARAWLSEENAQSMFVN
jgi:hypothetical protein